MEPDRAKYSDAGVGGPTPVGSFPRGASPYGILDMSGNVWEWTRTLYRDSLSDSQNAREDLEADGSRVVRGGSFLDLRWIVRAAVRRGNTPDSGSSSLGFRVVVSPFSSDL